MTDYTLESTIYAMFTTRSFTTGAPTVLAGTPVVSAYEDDSTTQITAGITLGVDHDSVVGMNLLTIVATAANGYETGKDYNLVVTTGTVGGVSVVGEVVATFSIERSSGFIRLGAPAGASVSADIADVPTVAELNARTLLAASYFDPSADTVANVTLVATTTTNTDMRGTDSAATAANLATVDTNVDAILVDTGTTLAAQISALNDISVSDILTTQMTEAYAADNVAPTLAQAIFLIQQTIGDFSITGTTITTKEIDGATTAATYTLDSASAPTSRTRAT